MSVNNEPCSEPLHISAKQLTGQCRLVRNAVTPFEGKCSTELGGRASGLEVRFLGVGNYRGFRFVD